MSVSYNSVARSTRRMSWFLLFLIGVALTVSLYFVKTHAQSAKKDVQLLSKAIAAEQASIRVLRAELAYLENPARISDLNEELLQLESIKPEQERKIEDIETLFPLTGEVEE